MKGEVELVKRGANAGSKKVKACQAGGDCGNKKKNEGVMHAGIAIS